MRVNLCYHFRHPFSDLRVRLSAKQKAISIAAGLALAPLLLIPGLIAFYGLTGYFKHKAVKKLDSHSQSKDVHGVDRAAKRALKGKEKLKETETTQSKTCCSEEDPLASSESTCEFNGGMEDLLQELLSESHIQVGGQSLDDQIRALAKDNSHFKVIFDLATQRKNDQLAALLLNAILKEAEEGNSWNFAESLLKSLDFKKIEAYFRLLNHLQIRCEDSDHVIYSHPAFLRRFGGEFFSRFLHFHPQATIIPLNLKEIGCAPNLFLNAYRHELFGKPVSLTEDNYQDYLSLAGFFAFGKTTSVVEQWMIDRFDRFEPGHLWELTDGLALTQLEQYLINYHLNHKPILLQEHLDAWLPHIQQLAIHQVITSENADLMVSMLAKCSCLQEIQLCTSDSSVLSSLSALPLKEIKLTLPNRLDDFGLIEDLPISTLVFGYSANDQDVGNISKLQLRVLRLTCGSRGATDKALESLAGMPLEVLDVRQTEITNQGLRFLKGKPIRELILSATEISDAGLNELVDMPLEILEVNNTKLEGNWGTFFVDKNISSLGLACTKITDQSLKDLQLLPIKELNIAGTAISNEGLSYLLGMSIEKLNACGTRVTGEGLKYLRDMPLRALKLQMPLRARKLQICNLTDQHIKHLVGKEIEELELRNAGISNKSLEDIGTMPIRRLAISCNRINNRGLKYLKTMPLEELDISQNKVKGSGLVDLPRGIKRLCLHGTSVTDQDLLHLKGMALEFLDLTYTKVNGTGCSHLAGMPIKELSLAGSQLVDKHLQHLKGLPLENLWIGHTKITGKGFGSLRGMPLKELDLDLSMTVDESLEQLDGLPIERLRLSSTKVKGKGFKHLLNLPLHHLELGYPLDPQFLDQLKKLPLKTLVWRGRNYITDHKDWFTEFQEDVVINFNDY
ncbi:MAG: hypothetical protein ACSNEK_00910 [Parachlamydiaceae bacterium]